MARYNTKYTTLIEWVSEYAVRAYTTPDSVRYRTDTMLRSHRRHRRLLYDARLQPKIVF